MTTCYFCHGLVEPAKVDYMAKRQGSYTLVKNLPVTKCTQCGEVYLDTAASTCVDEAIGKSRFAQERITVPVVHC